jgi:DNA-binding transcriptional regulator YhcF (GntR family)
MKYCEKRNFAPYQTKITIGLAAATACYPDLDEEDFIDLMRASFVFIRKSAQAAVKENASKSSK